MSEEFGEMRKKISEQSVRLKEFFDKQEKLAYLRQELSQLVTEQQYFNQYVEESDVNTDNIKFKKIVIVKTMDDVMAGVSSNIRGEKGNRTLV